MKRVSMYWVVLVAAFLAINSIGRKAWSQETSNQADVTEAIADASGYSELVADRSDLQAIRAFQERLEELERLKAQLLEVADQLRNTTLDGLLAQSSNIPLPDEGLPELGEQDALNPLDIYWEMSELLAQGLDTQGLSPEELEVLRLEYARVFAQASAEIWAAVRLPVIGDTPSKTTAFEAALVFPLLATGDSDWTHEKTQQFPAWALERDVLSQLQRIALRSRRAFTAYQLSLYRHTNPPEATRSGYIAYLRNTALDASGDGDHATFMVCMNTAIGIAKEAGLGGNVNELTFQLAEGLGGMEQHALAAEELNLLMSEQSLDDETHVRALLLRLKYLYDGEQFDAIVEQLPVLREDDRCQPYLPRIDYTLWVAHRRLGNGDDAQQLQDQFLEDYPDHVLGADIYFSLAMSSLASGDTDGAKKMLDVIQFNYPESRLIPRVTEIQERLGQ